MKQRLTALWNHRHFPKIRRLSNRANGALWGIGLTALAAIVLIQANVLLPRPTVEDGLGKAAFGLAMGEVGDASGMTEFGATFRTIAYTNELFEQYEEGGSDAALDYIVIQVHGRTLQNDYGRNPEALAEILTGAFWCCGRNTGAGAVQLAAELAMAEYLPFTSMRREFANKRMAAVGATDEQIAELNLAYDKSRDRQKQGPATDEPAEAGVPL